MSLVQTINNIVEGESRPVHRPLPKLTSEQYEVLDAVMVDLLANLQPFINYTIASGAEETRLVWSRWYDNDEEHAAILASARRKATLPPAPAEEEQSTIIVP